VHRGLPAGIYELYNSEDHYFVANNCQANIFVVEKELVAKILQVTRSVWKAQISRSQTMMWKRARIAPFIKCFLL